MLDLATTRRRLKFGIRISAERRAADISHMKFYFQVVWSVRKSNSLLKIATKHWPVALDEPQAIVLNKLDHLCLSINGVHTTLVGLPLNMISLGWLKSRVSISWAVRLGVPHLRPIHGEPQAPCGCPQWSVGGWGHHHGHPHSGIPSQHPQVLVLPVTPGTCTPFVDHTKVNSHQPSKGSHHLWIMPSWLCFPYPHQLWTVINQ